MIDAAIERDEEEAGAQTPAIPLVVTGGMLLFGSGALVGAQWPDLALVAILLAIGAAISTGVWVWWGR